MSGLKFKTKGGSSVLISIRDGGPQGSGGGVGKEGLKGGHLRTEGVVFSLFFRWQSGQ